ncbi:uncharacterized protein L199_004277 [Kwoniella botswanensis]|uniref:uncharacterized protein n=1 Tax=Kwoniella botswanensis TaxID=1268659 RepID=UPI00315DBC55
MTTSTPSADTWIYDHLHKVYFHPLSNSYAVPDLTTGQWNYIPASDFQSASTSLTQLQTVQGQTPRDEEKEEGEIEDDMGWGGLMDPDKLAQIEKDSKSTSKSKSASQLRANGHDYKNGTVHEKEKEKHPSYVVPYDDPAQYSYPSDGKDNEDEEEGNNRTKETPDNILRLVVVQSKCLDIGQVVIIDAREGGIQLGRDRCEKGGQARVRLREMEVSKTHSVIYWGKGGIPQEDEEEDGWWIVDLGSTHGTFLSNPSTDKTKRISEPKHSSKPHSIHHLAEIKIGSTTFSAHIHPSWPCDECTVNGNNEILLDDGKPKSKLDTVTMQDQIFSDHEVPYAMDSSQKKQNRELKRKREMALLKDSLLRRNEVSSSNDERDEPKREYLDRSAMRRRLHPSSPPKSQSNSDRATPDRTETPLTPSFGGDVSREPTGPSKFASSILANQGWIPGTGLGKSNQGRAQPIAVEMRNEKKGLGAQNSKAAVDDGQAQGDWKMRAKQRRWEELSKSNAN